MIERHALIASEKQKRRNEMQKIENALLNKKTRRAMQRKIWLCLLAVFLLLGSSVSSSVARVFLIEGVIEPPLRWYDDNDHLVGIDIDIITEVMRRMHNLIPAYTINLYKSQAKLNSNWRHGIGDMVFTFSIKLDRQKHLYYSKVSHIQQSYYFFLTNSFLKKERLKGREVKFETFSDLSTYRIGATQGVAYIPEFWRAAKNGVLNLDIVVKNDLNMRKLLEGRIDLLPHSLIPALWYAKQGGFLDKLTYLPKPIKNVPYYNTFVKTSTYPGIQNSSLIDVYDDIIAQMHTEGVIRQILANYGIDESKP